MKNSILFLVFVFNLLNVEAKTKHQSNSDTDVVVAASTNFVYFSVEQKKQEVVLNWKTATEKDNAFFTIEKSSDGEHFNVLTTEDGAGTYLSEREYFSVDFLPSRGVSYYRLSQTNFDGSKHVFEIQKVEYKVELTFFPNPEEQQYSIYGIPKNTHAQVTLIDADGKEISKLEFKDNGAILVDLYNVKQEVAFIKIKDDYSEWLEKVER